MKKLQPVALVCSGNLTDSAITRFRGLAERLGPVKSTSLRLASRFVNILRAGHPVNDYEALRDCRLLLVALPDAVAPDAVRDLERSGWDWTRRYVVLCSTLLESDALAPLAEMGAHTASICEGAASDGRLFLAEGDREAIKQVRPLVEGSTRSRIPRVVRLLREHKKFYHAASACTGPLLMSLLVCAGECLKLSGMAATDAAEMIETQAGKTTRSFLSAGRNAYQGPLDLNRQIAALCAHHPEAAEFLQVSAKFAGRLVK